jgi:hypothetical protein
MPTNKQTWNFHLPDEDRSTGWTNHGYVLQYVCNGTGDTPQDAWLDALANGNVPEGYQINGDYDLPSVAIRDEHEIRLALTMPPKSLYTRAVSYELEADTQEEAEELWDAEGPEASGDVNLVDSGWQNIGGPDGKLRYIRFATFTLTAYSTQHAESVWADDGPEIGAGLTVLHSDWMTAT